MKQRIVEVFSDNNDNIRERIFCTTDLIGIVMALIGIVETIPIADSPFVIVVLTLLLITLLMCLFLTLRFKLLKAASIVLGIVICLLVFPSMFFVSGGINGGATVYFSLNIIYTFIMFDGYLMFFFLALDILSNLCVYMIAYHFPEFVIPLQNHMSVVIDSMLSVIIVGFSIGIMIKLYINANIKQEKTVEMQKEELIKTASSKNRLFASMSHEIRMPINTIIGLNEMILRESKDSQILEYADDVKSASKMLLSLVNDIMDLSQMEMGKMEIIPSDYSTVELLKELVNMAQIQTQEKKLDFILDFDKDLPRVLYGDKRRIQQVLINILNNAVKYTKEGSITFSVKMEERNKDTAAIVFSVKDTGIGIRKEDISKLYDVFSRVDLVKNHAVEGSGLGLAITKQLVDLMEGELAVDSIYTKGSEFTVTLKQRIVDETPVGYIEEKEKTNAGLSTKYSHLFEAPEARILIVDDNIINIKVAVKLLEKTKVKIDSATSGKECLEKTQNKFYHVILLDHVMPEMDGIETAAQIRSQANGLCRDSVIIAMTANVKADAERFYKQYGFDMYFEKPIIGNKLEECLLSCIPSEIIEYHKDSDESGNPYLFNTVKIQRKKRVMITTDCVAELSTNLTEQYAIGVMYLYIKTDKGRFADTREIHSDSYSYNAGNDNSFVKADSASVEEYEQFFAENMTKADEIIHISMSSEIGKSYSIAKKAAESFGRVHIIDSKQFSCGLGLLVLYAAKLAQGNLSTEQIIKNVENYTKNIEFCFILPSIKVYYQNGYASKFMKKLCENMHLYPCIAMKNGKLRLKCFYRGDVQAARKKLLRKILSRGKIDRETFFITHVLVSVREQDGLIAEVNRLADFENVYMQKASFTCACNSGIGSIGYAYKKIKE